MDNKIYVHGKNIQMRITTWYDTDTMKQSKEKTGHTKSLLQMLTRTNENQEPTEKNVCEKKETILKSSSQKYTVN